MESEPEPASVDLDAIEGLLGGKPVEMARLPIPGSDGSCLALLVPERSSPAALSFNRRFQGAPVYGDAILVAVDGATGKIESMGEREIAFAKLRCAERQAEERRPEPSRIPDAPNPRCKSRQI